MHLKLLMKDILIREYDGFLGRRNGTKPIYAFKLLSYAIDYNNDERKDIWTTLEDVFASSANYLSRSGWIIILHGVGKKLLLNL